MSTPPTEKKGRLAEIRQAYTAIKQVDPQIGWWMIGAGVGTLLIIVLIGTALGHPVYALISGIPAGLLAAVVVMNRRGSSAMYAALEGQPGAAGAALHGMGKRGWYTEERPVAVDAARGTKVTDMSNAAMVFRAVGRCGVVLLAEGPPSRAQRLLTAEQKKAARVVPGVPIHTYIVGQGEDELPISKIAVTLAKIKPVMTKDEMGTVNKRLRAIGGIKPAVPAGMDPTKARVDRRAMRGK